MAAIESQQLSCHRQAPASETVGEQPEMADSHEAFGQHVEAGIGAGTPLRPGS